MAGPVDIDPAKPHAFLSYRRFDDKVLNGGISALREALEQLVQARTGKPFNIFQDVEDIASGDAWRNKLDRAIEAAQLFVPILTPSFFESEFCKGEARAFLDYEARAGRDDLVLPIYLIDAPKLAAADQRAADDIATRLHERQYADWRPLRFRLRHDDTRPHIDELAGAIASAIARSAQAVRPPPEPALPEEVIERPAALEAGLEEERSRRQLAESALADEETKTRELAEAPLAFEGQVEAAKKTEATLRSEIASLRKQLAATGVDAVKQRLHEAAAALEAERAKGEQITRDASVIPRSFFLGAAALAALPVGASSWMAGQGGSSPDIDQLRLRNQELVEQLRESQSAVAALQASASTDQASEDRAAELTKQVESLSAELADSREAFAAAEENARQKFDKALAEIKGVSADQTKPRVQVSPLGTVANAPRWS